MTDLELVSVHTRILTDKDNIVDIMEHYAKDKIGPDDVITVAESVVAITQGRFTRPEDLDPCFLAKVLCRFIPQEGSMSSVYGMQAVMDIEGEYRVLYAMIVGMLSKIMGKSGVFYNLAGRQAALIDDVTGTMPPFDKCLVYGPAHASQVAQEIKDRLGCYGAAVADVNDLKRSLIVGTSEGLPAEELAKILIDNPFGNSNQQTPIVIIKNYAAAKARAES